MNTVFLCAIFAATTLSAAPYRFISFNVWGNFFGNPPSERDVAQTEILREHNPDFIALQEMTADYWASRLVSGLRADYETVGEKMGPDGIDAFIPILYRREGFELLGKGAKWFCKELDTSKGVIWAALRDRRSGVRIIVFSSHFWWRTDGRGDDFIRLENARRLYEEVTAAAAKYDAAIVGGGDLNATGVSSAFLELKRLGWKDGQETAPRTDSRPTWRDEPVRDSRTGRYRGVTFEAAKRTMTLDHAFYAPERVGAYEFRLDCSQKALDTSDHVPIIFDFTVHPKAAWKAPGRG